MTTGMARIYRRHDAEWPDDVSPTTRAKPQLHSPTVDHKLTDYCEQGVPVNTELAEPNSTGNSTVKENRREDIVLRT